MGSSFTLPALIFETTFDGGGSPCTNIAYSVDKTTGSKNIGPLGISANRVNALMIDGFMESNYFSTVTLTSAMVGTYSIKFIATLPNSGNSCYYTIPLSVIDN